VRILIVRAGALGDVLLLRPAIRGLRAGGHSVTLVAPATPAHVLAGEVERVIPWEGRDVAALLQPGSAPPTAFADHDLAVAFTRSADLTSALRAILPVRARDPRPPPGVHAADWVIAEVADLVAKDVAPPIRVTPEALRTAEPLLARLGPGFLALHPGSGSPAKSWPRDRYRLLAERLAGRDQAILVVEGPADREAASAFDDDSRAVFARGLDLPALGALLSHAGLLVGNDSGVAHLAAAYGVSCLVLFGATEPAEWRPIGPRVETLRGAKLEALDVEQVFETAAALFCSLRATSSGPGLPSG